MAAGTADTELQVEQVVLRIHPAPEVPHGATADFAWCTSGTGRRP